MHALKAGYRLIDCAYCYGNEAEVGEGLREAFEQGIVKREDVFVVTKVWATYTSRCALGLQKSLDALGLDYVDLFLVHWPLLMNPEGKCSSTIWSSSFYVVGDMKLTRLARQRRPLSQASQRRARYHPLSQPR